MNKLFYTIAFLFALSQLAYADITLSVTPSRTSGAAPLCVFFDATATTSTNHTTPDDTAGSWMNILNSANFGDTTAGNWNYGVNNNWKNYHNGGAVAAHCYETAGSSNWVWTANDGQSIKNTSGTITVTSPDTQWSGTKTICFTTGTDFTDCPSGATQVDSVSNIATSIAANIGTGDVRLLLKTGDTFNVGSTIALNQAIGLLGSYGNGAKPIVTTTGDSSITVSASDWRITNINFTGGNSIAIDARNASADNLSVIDVEINSQAKGIYSASVTGLFVQDSVIDTITDSSGYALYLLGEQIAAMGNFVNDVIASDQSGHAIRSDNAFKFSINNNTITNVGASQASITIRAPNYTSDDDISKFIIVSDNKISPGTTGGEVSFRATNSISDQRVHYVIAERNWFEVSGNPVTVMSSYTVVRNNLFDATLGGQAMININSLTTVAPLAEWLTVGNNTCYAGNTAVTNFICANAFDGSNITISNNLLYAPNRSGAFVTTWRDFSTPNFSAFNNTTDNPPNETAASDPDFSSASPSTPDDFIISSTSYGSAGGGSSFPAQYSDFLYCRNLTNNRIGAFTPNLNKICPFTTFVLGIVISP